MRQRYAIAFFVIFNLNVFAFLTPEQVLILHDQVNSEMEMFSIIHGANAYESGKIENIHKGNDSSPESLQKLTRCLFNISKGQFATSVAKNNPGSYLTLCEIANLISAIELNNLQDYLPKLVAILLCSAQEKFPDDFKKSDQRGSFKRHFKQFQINLNNTISDTDKQSVYEILFAYLYCKALSYEQAVECYYLIEEKLKTKILQGEGFKQPYDQEIENFDTDFSDIPDAKNQFLALAKKNYLGELPVQLIQQYIIVENNEIPDCVEVALREFCNNYLYDSKLLKFDLSKLPKNIKADPLTQFYSDRSCTPLTARAFRFSVFWFKLISNIENVEYVRQQNIEMRPTKSNILQTLNFLYSTKANNFDELCKEISSDQISLTCKEEKEDTPVGVADVLIFNVNNLNGKKFIFIMHLIPYEKVWHAWTEIKTED